MLRETTILSVIAIAALCCPICSCRTTKTVQPRPTTKSEGYSPSTLIVFYDAKVGSAPLLSAIEKMRGEVLYKYSNFNAVAFKIPDNAEINAVMKSIGKVKGVLNVERDRIMHLDNTKIYS